MNPHHRYFLIVVFLLCAAAGCAPLNTPQVVAPTMQPESTPTTALETSTKPLNTPTLLPSIIPSQAHPILVFPPYDSPGGYLLGAARDGDWLSSEYPVARPSPQQDYALYSARDRQGSAVGGEPVEEPTCPSFWSVPIKHPAGVAAAIGADWDALPRVPQAVDVNDPQVVQQVRDFLISQGIDQPAVKIQRSLQVDLEGDGIPEFLVAASRFVEETGHDVNPGDYSIILLLREGQTALPVVSDRYTREESLVFPDRYGLLALLDLNGDGHLEILVEITGWEKTGALAFTIDGSALENVLQARCP